MKFTIDPIIFELFPDFNAGLVAMKGIDNLVQDRDIEAFLRHASLAAGLLMKLKPLASDHGVRSYRDVLEKLGAEGVPAMERVIRELGEHIAAEQQAALAGQAENAAREASRASSATRRCRASIPCGILPAGRAAVPSSRLCLRYGR